MKRLGMFLAALAVLVSPPAVAGSLCLSDGGKATYDADGSYTYVASSGRTATGKYRGSPTAGRSVTVKISDGRTRADRFVREGGQLYLVTKRGNRYRANPC